MLPKYLKRPESCLDWNPMSLEAARVPGTNHVVVYGAAKTLAEREIWKFAEEHPEIDVTSSAFSSACLHRHSDRSRLTCIFLCQSIHPFSLDRFQQVSSQRARKLSRLTAPWGISTRRYYKRNTEIALFHILNSQARLSLTFEMRPVHTCLPLLRHFQSSPV